MIRLVDLHLRHGERVLFAGVEARIDPHDRIGLVGSNGAGKTTLLNILTGTSEADTGRIEKAGYVTIGHLPQDGIVHAGTPLRTEVERAFEDILAIQARIDAASDELREASETNRRDEILEVIGELEHRLDDLEAHKLRSKVERVLFGLGFSAADMERDCAEFSGGWQMRIALAKLLLREPSLLLLDEPTNHLDLDSLRWLEGHLGSYDGAIMLVSHDRAFLDALCSRTFHLSQGRLDVYRGNYSHFETEHRTRRELRLKAAENQRRERAHLQSFVDRFRYKASKASQAQSRIKQLEKMEIIEVEEEESTIGFRFPPPRRSGEIVLTLEGISKQYGPIEVLRELDLEIRRGDRVAVVGVNGAGKSTLTRIIAGAEPFQAGRRRLGHNVELSYFAQNQADELDGDMTVLELASEVARDSMRGQERNVLGAFLFRGDDVFKPARVLSGGEKNRLALARMLMRTANFLVFDEPTNHLDMQSKGVLQEAIKAYEGTVVIVSHDRAFLDPLVNRVVEVRRDGVRQFPGNLSEFINSLVDDAVKAPASPDPGPGGSARDDRNPKARRQLEAERRQRLAALKKRSSVLEKRAAELEREIAEFEAAMSDPAFFKTDDHPEKLRRYHRIKNEMDQTLAEWESSLEKLESGT